MTDTSENITFPCGRYNVLSFVNGTNIAGLYRHNICTHLRIITEILKDVRFILGLIKSAILTMIQKDFFKKVIAVAQKCSVNSCRSPMGCSATQIWWSLLSQSVSRSVYLSYKWIFLNFQNETTCTSTRPIQRFKVLVFYV